MLASNALSFLSWNPRLTEHGKGYDNPWQRNRNQCGIMHGKKIGDAVRVMVENIMTGKSVIFPSISDAARALNSSTSRVSDRAKTGKLLAGKYRVVKC